MNNKTLINKYLGFTLIEIAIVIAIIGILLLGLSSGSGLLDNARLKSLKSQYDKVNSAVYVYNDRFSSFPGDDQLANLHVSGTVASSSTLNNGLVDGNWNSDSNTSESRLFWQHLRLANLYDGFDTSLPKNKFNGSIGVQANIYGFKSNALCFSNILGNVAKEFEIKYDNGNQTNSLSTGKIRAGTSGTYIDDNSYTICMLLQ